MSGPAYASSGSQEPKTPNLWAGPLFALLVLLTPTLILIFSNLEKAELEFAGLKWTAPLWLILLATFVAGIILGRLFGWLWRVFRRRRERMKSELAGKATPGA